MRNIKLTIAYDGTRYRGWQLQSNGVTVQGELEKAILKLTGKKSRLSGASRTDSGVHARCQAANFRTSSKIPAEKIPYALNQLLPSDISVIDASEEDHDFDSRFSAREKTYRYYIYISKSRDPFREKYAWRVLYPLNALLMKREAKALLGKHDFKSFQASDKRERSSTRTILGIDVSRKKEEVIITVRGDGFLYNMVRNIAGTLVDIGRGYLAPGSMKAILAAKDRTKAGPTAPARGLFLEKIVY